MEELRDIIVQISQIMPKLGVGLFILLTFILASWLIKRIITKRIKPRIKNPLLAIFIGKLVAFVITVTGFVIFLNVIGLGGFAKHIMAGAGITTFVIGFAFKDIGENFLSGILMAFKSPFKIGDLIETNGTTGYVNELNMRDSVIKTLDGKDVFIPNSQIIKAPLFNYTIDGFLRYEIVIGIDYSEDLVKVISIIKSVLLQIPEVLQGDKKPVVVIDQLDASTININILYWIDTFKSKAKSFHHKIKSDIIINILDELHKNNIYLPGNILEIKNYKKEMLITSSNV